jgi:hypothetical protein
MKNENGSSWVFVWKVTKENGCSLSMAYSGSDLMASSHIDEEIKKSLRDCIKGQTYCHGRSSWKRIN